MSLRSELRACSLQESRQLLLVLSMYISRCKCKVYLVRAGEESSVPTHGLKGQQGHCSLPACGLLVVSITLSVGALVACTLQLVGRCSFVKLESVTAMCIAAAFP